MVSLSTVKSVGALKPVSNDRTVVKRELVRACGSVENISSTYLVLLAAKPANRFTSSTC